MYVLRMEAAPGHAVRLPKEGLAAIYRDRLSAVRGPDRRAPDQIVDDEAVVYRPVENILVPPPWYRGRVVSSATPHTPTSPHCGQGGAQAVEDGIVLTEELTRHDARRRPRGPG